MVFPFDVDATWVNPLSVALNGGELRRADSAGFTGAGGALGVWGGVVRHGDTSLAVTVDGSDVVTVQAGPVVIPGDAVAGTGCYRSALSAAITGALGARHATQSRIDLVVFRMLDDDVVGTHDAYTARVDVVPGTPSATPAVPTKPSMAVEIGRITVPPTGGGAATVDSSFRTYAAAIGGILPVPTSARLPASAAKGQRAIALDTLVEYRWSGSAWAAQGGGASGQVRSVVPTSGDITVTHGLGSTPTIIQITPAALPAPGPWIPTVTARTSTTFKVSCRYFNNTVPGTALSFDWTAQ